MEIGWQTALAGAAVLFLGFLLVKMRPGIAKRSALGGEVRAARDRAYAATTPRDRAAALCEAGELAIGDGARWTAAAGFFLRAMKADPTSAEVVERTAQALHRRRPRLLEKILWRRLGHTPWDAEHREAQRAAAAALARIYEHAPRDAAKATVLRRLSKTLEG